MPAENKLMALLQDYYENRKYGEIILKIEAGKIVRYETKEVIQK